MKKIQAFLFDNIVTLIFVVFVTVGILVSQGLSIAFFVNELLSRFFRNALLVLSLIIPVTAGLGLNFGIVVGALAGILAIIVVRFFEIGGLPGLLLCFLLAFPLSLLFGYATGKLFNRTRGQEMIASLIVGFFATGVYQFIVLFAIGVIIPVNPYHPMIKPDGIGLMATFDMGVHYTRVRDASIQTPGLHNSLDWIYRAPAAPALIFLSLCMLAYLIFQWKKSRKNPSLKQIKPWRFYLNCGICVIFIGLGIYGLMFPFSSFFYEIRPIPAATGLVIAAFCFAIHYFTKTKLGQDCRSVGHSQYIAKVSGIDVDRTRIIATIISTALASWGMIIFLQNMGTVSTYTAHMQIGMFSVAALLVGGASTSRANVKNALVGVILFNAMFIVSPAIGRFFSGDEGVGEYTRSFMVYGVIGLALGLYIWKDVKAEADRNKLEIRTEEDKPHELDGAKYGTHLQ